MVTGVIGARFAGGEYVDGAVELTDNVVGLDLLLASSRSTGAMNNKLYHVANSVYCHIKTGDNTVVADATCTLLAPGERLMVLPAEYVAVIKATGASDGIIRFTEVLN